MDYSNLTPNDIITIPLSKLILEQVVALSGGVVAGWILGFILGFSIGAIMFSLPNIIDWCVQKVKESNDIRERNTKL